MGEIISTRTLKDINTEWNNIKTCKRRTGTDRKGKENEEKEMTKGLE